MSYLVKGGVSSAEETALRMQSALDVFEEQRGRRSGLGGISQ